MSLIVLALLLDAGCAAGPPFHREVEGLGGLPGDCTREAFLGREPVWRLLAAGPDARRALQKGLDSPDWSVRASSLFIMSTNGFELGRMYVSFKDDPHPFVRALASSIVGSVYNWAGDIAARPREGAIIKRLRFPRPSDAFAWLPSWYLERRLDRMFEILEEPDPLEGTIDSIEGGSGARLKPRVQAASTVILGALQSGERGHGIAERIVNAALRIPSDQPDTLGVSLEFIFSIQNHEHRDPAGRLLPDCPGVRGWPDRLIEEMRETVLKSGSRYLLYQVGFIVKDWYDHAPSQKLFQDLIHRHPSAEARKYFAGLRKSR